MLSSTHLPLPSTSMCRESCEMKPTQVRTKWNPGPLPTCTNSVSLKSPVGDYAELCCHRTTGPGVRKVSTDLPEWEKEFAVFLRQRKTSQTSTGNSVSSSNTDEAEDSEFDSKAVEYEEPSECKQYPANGNDYHSTGCASDAYFVYLLPQALPCNRMTETTSQRRRLSGLSRSKSTVLNSVYGDRKTALMQQFSQAWS